ncbi:hypothetical protein N9N67_00015 [Bacteriovoracaceae bacterium]|nr:hypothetical protein [Bacteriovoracaceae bacterium]
MKSNFNIMGQLVCPLFFSFFLMSSCSITRTEKTLQESDGVDIDYNKPKYSELDYVDHFSSFNSSYVKSKQIKEVRLRSSHQEYLESLIQSVSNNNELFFQSLGSEKIEITVIEDSRPFHFSLPKNKIFLSSGLLAKFISHEAVLICLLAYEMIRIEKNVYNRNTIIPLGYLSTERILSLTRISIQDKLTVHKWAYYLLKRADLNAQMYLSWIQIQNRNGSEFKLMYPDAEAISREETLFKAFLISHSNKIGNIKEQLNSKKFYNLITYLKTRFY